MFGLMPGYNNLITNFFNDSFYNEDPFESGLTSLMESMNQMSSVNLMGSMNDQFKIDVKENDNAYAISASLPGIKKEEIGLDYRDGTIYISVNHNEDINQDQNGYMHRERRTMSMQRGVYVGDVDAQGLQAKFENGLLQIIAPKIAVPENQYRIEIE